MESPHSPAVKSQQHNMHACMLMNTISPGLSTLKVAPLAPKASPASCRCTHPLAKRTLEKLLTHGSWHDPAIHAIQAQPIAGKHHAGTANKQGTDMHAPWRSSSQWPPVTHTMQAQPIDRTHHSAPANKQEQTCLAVQAAGEKQVGLHASCKSMC